MAPGPNARQGVQNRRCHPRRVYPMLQLSDRWVQLVLGPRRGDSSHAPKGLLPGMLEGRHSALEPWSVLNSRLERGLRQPGLANWGPEANLGHCLLYK